MRVHVVISLLCPVHFFRNSGAPLLASFQNVARDVFVFTYWMKMVGDVGYRGWREKWSASYDDDVEGVPSAVAAEGKLVSSVGYCVQSPMDVRKQNLRRGSEAETGVVPRCKTVEGEYHGVDVLGWVHGRDTVTLGSKS